MGSETILINTSRGEVIDQRALIESVLAGRIGRVGLDVLSEEPHVPDALRLSDRVLLTAHSAFYADASLSELRVKAANAARRFLLGQPVHDIVNPFASGSYPLTSQTSQL
jgi:lactate dehydrogenase-like 2-hydroxyacid dehydrogenase